MRSPIDMYKVYQLIKPQLATATVTGTGVQFTPNNDPLVDAFALANVGSAAGTPDSFTVVYTIEQSATVGGTYTVTDTFATGTTATQSSARAFKLDSSKPFVRAKATIAFVNGTTPSIAIACDIFVKQNNASTSNNSELS